MKMGSICCFNKDGKLQWAYKIEGPPGKGLGRIAKAGTNRKATGINGKGYCKLIDAGPARY